MSETDPVTATVIDVSQSWADTLITVDRGDGSEPIQVTAYDLVEATTNVGTGDTVTLFEG